MRNSMVGAWRAARLPTLLLSISPFALGSIAGAQVQGFSLQVFALALIAVVVLHIAANLINEWMDFNSGVDALAAEAQGGILTAPGVLLAGACSLVELRGASLMMLVLGVGIGGVFAIQGAMLPAALIGTGGALAVAYTPLAYRGHGLAEIAAVVGYGFLPASLGYAVQTSVISSDAILLGASHGFLAASLLLMHDYLHPEADRMAEKHTPVVAFGPMVAWTLLGALIAASYVGLSAAVMVNGLPLWALLLWVTALPMAWTWLRMRPPATSEAVFTALQYATQTHLLFASMLIVAIAVRG